MTTIDGGQPVDAACARKGRCCASRKHCGREGVGVRIFAWSNSRDHRVVKDRTVKQRSKERFTPSGGRRNTSCAYSPALLPCPADEQDIYNTHTHTHTHTHRREAGNAVRRLHTRTQARTHARVHALAWVDVWVSLNPHIHADTDAGRRARFRMEECNAKALVGNQGGCTGKASGQSTRVREQVHGQRGVCGQPYGAVKSRGQSARKRVLNAALSFGGWGMHLHHGLVRGSFETCATRGVEG